MSTDAPWRSLSDFDRAWQVIRDITDHKASQTARFEGKISTFWEGTTLLWRETGTLEQGGAQFAASRLSRWTAVVGGIDVAFEDGRFFHHLAACETSETRHDCAPDIYDLAYDFKDWPNWRLDHRVRGPRKDYAMSTRYITLPD